MSNKILFFLFLFMLVAAACKKKIDSYYSSDGTITLPAGQNCSVEDEAVVDVVVVVGICRYIKTLT